MVEWFEDLRHVGHSFATSHEIVPLVGLSRLLLYEEISDRGGQPSTKVRGDRNSHQVLLLHHFFSCAQCHRVDL